MKIESVRVKRSVVIDGVRYCAGDEDVLDALLDDDQKQRYADHGILQLKAATKRTAKKSNDAKRDSKSVEA
jgi:hypothetical protein